MATLNALINEVCDDIKRTDLTAQCSAAVVDAIRHYDSRRWWFAEGSATFSTTASTTAYALPADFRNIDYAEIKLPGDDWQELRRRDFPYIRSMLEGGSTVTGYPQAYAIRDQKMHLAYTPNGSYAVRLYYQRTLADLSATESNAWTTDCRALIRAHASEDVALRTLHDAELAQFFTAKRRDEERRLLGENDRRVASGTVTPH